MNKHEIVGYTWLASQGLQFIDGLIAHKSVDPQDHRAGKRRMESAAVTAISALLLTRFSKNPVPRQIEKLENKLLGFMQKEGIPLSMEEWEERANAFNQRNWNQKLSDFMFNYPIEAAGISSIIGSIGLMASGRIRRRHGEKSAGTANLGQGLLIFAGSLIQMLPEKTKERLEAEGKDGTVLGHIQKHPLGYASALFMASDVMQGKTALAEYNRAQLMDADDPFRPWVYLMSAISA